MATTDPANLPGAPVDPAQAQGAQIPLQTFTIPEFPPSARGLKALTLTSDIKIDEYQDILSQPYTIPVLPYTIESLTLELFSLGYPPGFLSALADRLPNIKTLVVYSQLFAGITDESQADAVQFFRKLKGLRALHMLDVFAKPHFFERAGPYVTYNTTDEDARRGLMFIEVNYTFRHEDEDFMAKIQATELPFLMGPGCISVAYNVSAPEENDDPEDPTNLRNEKNEEQGNKEGVMAFNKTLGPELVDALVHEETGPKGLRALNTTLYTLTLHQLKRALAKQRGLLVLNATVEVEPTEECKKELLEALGQCEHLEQVEIVANPSLQFFMAVSALW